MLRKSANKPQTETSEAAGAPPDEQALTVPDSGGALVVPPEPLLGFENFDDGDLIIPRLSVVQPTSKDGTPGTFRSNLTGEEKEALHITPMTYSKGMVLWSEELGNDPQCRSNNALVPDPAIEVPKNDRCAERIGNRLNPVCPYALWRGKEPPTCKKTYNLIAMDMDGMRPFLLSLHGTSVRSARALISHVWQLRKSLFDVACRLGLNKVTNQRGSFYVVEFSDFTYHDPGTFRELYESIRAYDVGRTFQAEQDAVEGESAPPDKF